MLLFRPCKKVYTINSVSEQADTDLSRGKGSPEMFVIKIQTESNSKLPSTLMHCFDMALATAITSIDCV